MYCRLRRGGGCDSRSDGSGELSGRRHTMQKIAYAASNRLPTLLKEEPEILTAKSEVDKAHAILAEYGNLDERAKLFVEKVQQLEAQIKDAKDKDAGAQASWTSINQQRQNVENLNSQVSKDAADIKSTVEDVKKIDAEVQEIKDSAEKELEEKIADLNENN